MFLEIPVVISPKHLCFNSSLRWKRWYLLGESGRNVFTLLLMLPILVCCLPLNRVNLWSCFRHGDWQVTTISLGLTIFNGDCYWVSQVGYPSVWFGLGMCCTNREILKILIKSQTLKFWLSWSCFAICVGLALLHSWYFSRTFTSKFGSHANCTAGLFKHVSVDCCQL